MRWRVDCTGLARHLLWASLVLAVAAYGSVIVRNVTDALVEITHQPSSVVIQQATR
jgi:hypothetical protein